MRGEDQQRIPVREGDVLGGKYRVERVLGSGGMGIVVAARHLQLDERVAIEFLHPDALSNAEAVARFEREARAAAKIKSEHVARVSDVGTLDDGGPYMIMEYLEGEDLAHWLQQRGPLAIDQAVEFVLQTCEAMAEAHALGIVHRDLKPANLFCIRRTDGLLSIKVLDFGISKITIGGPGLDMTHADAVMGSPLYMSPEQMLSARSVDARTDIWSIGVILYELITGLGPFPGETLPEVCMSVGNRPTPSMRATRPEVPAALDAVIAKCLKKSRKSRYANVAELAVALAPFGPKRARISASRITRVIDAAGLSQNALSIPPSSNPSSEPSGPATMASWGRTDARPMRQRAGMLGAATLLGLGVGVVAASWFVQRPKPEGAGPSLDAPAKPAMTESTATVASIDSAGGSAARASSSKTASPGPSSTARVEPAASAPRIETTASAPRVPTPASSLGATSLVSRSPTVRPPAPTFAPRTGAASAPKAAPAASTQDGSELGGRL